MSLRALFATVHAKDGAPARSACQDADGAPTVSSGAPAARGAGDLADADASPTARASFASSTPPSSSGAAKTYTRRTKPKARLSSVKAERDSATDGAARPAKAAKASTQMCLDLGQASLRHVSCATCGLVYAKGDPSDEKTHAKYHEKFIVDGASGGMTLKLPTNARVVWTSDDGDVTCIILDEASKVERVARGVERELIMPENFVCSTSGLKAFVCVAKKSNKVLAALFAEKISGAFRTLEESIDEAKARSTGGGGLTVKCGIVEEKAMCGVRAIWTHASARKKGYARAMLNAMRAHLVPGYVVPVKECAFTQPTEAGAALALRYCDDATFLVY